MALGKGGRPKISIRSEQLSNAITKLATSLDAGRKLDERRDIGPRAIRLALLERDAESGQTYIELVVEALVNAAIRGTKVNVKAAELLLAHAYGKPGQDQASAENVQRIALLVGQLGQLDLLDKEHNKLAASSSGATGGQPIPPTTDRPPAVIEPHFSQPHAEHQNHSSNLPDDDAIIDGELQEAPDGSI